MRLVDLISQETGADLEHIMLLRHSDKIIHDLTKCGAIDHDALIEELTFVQRTNDVYDFWWKGKPKIDVVAVVVHDRLYGVFRVLGVEAKGTMYSLSSTAFKEYNNRPERQNRRNEPSRRFRMERIGTKADNGLISGWEGSRTRTPTSRNGGAFFREIEVSVPDIPSVYADDQGVSEAEIARAARDNRLRFRNIPTSSREAVTRQRIGQNIVRAETLKNYNTCCAVCDVSDAGLLRASHIVGWAECEESRGDLRNVICLCGFHDVLFENGYWSLDDQLGIIIRSGIQSHAIRRLLAAGCAFRQSAQFPPRLDFIRRHRAKHGLGGG
jgi:hypothetical protein